VILLLSLTHAPCCLVSTAQLQPRTAIAADWQAQQRNLGGPLDHYTHRDAGNNAQNLFHAPLGLVHRESSNLIQILATEVCI